MAKLTLRISLDAKRALNSKNGSITLNGKEIQSYTEIINEHKQPQGSTMETKKLASITKSGSQTVEVLFGTKVFSDTVTTTPATEKVIIKITKNGFLGLLMGRALSLKVKEKN